MNKITHEQYESALKVIIDYENQLREDIEELTLKSMKVKRESQYRGLSLYRARQESNLIDAGASTRLLNLVTSNVEIATNAGGQFVFTVKDLSEIRVHEFHKWKNFGDKSMREVIMILRYAGLSLKDI